MQMDRQETCDFISESLSKRVVATRYSDGEFLIMQSRDHWLLPDMDKNVGKLLLSSIKMTNQLVCINQLKPHNIDRRDQFFLAHQFFLDNSDHDRYGNANWNIHDFIHGSEVLSNFFVGKTLLVGGCSDELVNVLKDVNPQISYYLTDKTKAGNDFENHLIKLRKEVSDYDNVLFFCGPISKALIPRLVENTTANLVDLGALNLAILEGALSKNYTSQWAMSWASQHNLQKLFQQLKDKIYRRRE